jgi:hypothetical protein
MAIARLIVGTISLIAGRALYWLFVAAAGFIVALTLASQFIQGESELVLIIIALGAGFIGAVLAVFAQRIAVAIAGFLMGGFALLTLFDIFNLSVGTLDWVLYLITGIAGAVLVSVLFDWALIFISSLAGATFIVQALDPNPTVSVVLFFALLLIGIIIQHAALRRAPAREKSG